MPRILVVLVGMILGLTPMSLAAWDWGEEVQVDSGFLFVNGKYIPPPYYLRFEPELTLNGHPVAKPVDALLERQSRGSIPLDPRTDPQLEIQRNLIDVLFLNRVIVIQDNEPLVCLDQPEAVLSLLRFWTTHRRDEDCLNTVISSLPSYANATNWQNWLTSFRPRRDLRRRAIESIRKDEIGLATNLSQVAAVQRLRMWEYPLSLAGMIIGVLTLGHLIRYRPILDQQVKDETLRTPAVRATVVCILLMLVNGGLDWIWSTLAQQVGQMREVNPFVVQPGLVVHFKIGTTTLGCGLLFLFRRVYFAQSATWWICLVCVLLTFRWLFFQFMFLLVTENG